MGGFGGRIYNLCWRNYDFKSEVSVHHTALLWVYMCFVCRCLCGWDSHLHPQQWNVVLWSCLEPWSQPPSLCRWGWASPERSGSGTLWVHRRMSWSAGSKRQKIPVFSMYKIYLETHMHTYRTFVKLQMLSLLLLSTFIKHSLFVKTIDPKLDLLLLW